jgi:predicted RNase H-like nuclease (RuvC/YqgF family)
MENKNPANTLKNTATLTKFEVLIGQVEEIKTQNRSLKRINEALGDEIDELKSALEAQTDKNKELRKELKSEKIRSNNKVKLDDFHLELTSVMKRIEFGDIKVEDGWKTIIDTLIEEIEKCIILIQNMQGQNE